MCEWRADATSAQLMDAAGPVAHAMEKEDADGEGDDLSLEEILTLYDQPINEEQAWAVCYQCCRDLSGSDQPRVVRGPGDVRIHKDGTIRLQKSPGKIHQQTNSN